MPVIWRIQRRLHRVYPFTRRLEKLAEEAERRCHLYTKEGGECRHAHSRGREKEEKTRREKWRNVFIFIRVIATRARVDQGAGQLPRSKYECDKKNWITRSKNCSFPSFVAERNRNFILASRFSLCVLFFFKRQRKIRLKYNFENLSSREIYYNSN